MIFDSVKCRIQHQRKDVAVHATALCSIEPFLAVSYSDGKICIFDCNSSLVAPEMKRNNESATSILWIPRTFMLVIGWESGCVTVWRLKKNEESDFRFSCEEILSDNSIHAGKVALLRTNADGSLMVSVGSDQSCCLWSTSRLQPVVCHHNNIDSPITDAKFWDNSKSDREHTVSTFFFSSQSGRIFRADDENCKEVFDASAKVMALQPCISLSRLIVVSTALLMIQLSVHDDGSVLEIKRMKLSAGSNACIVWISPTSLVSANGENKLRVWDIESNISYAISRKSTDLDPSERYISLAYNKRSYRLAAGTLNGSVVVWRLLGNTHEQILRHDEERWKAISIQRETVGCCVDALQWSSEGNILSVEVSNEVFIMEERRLQHTFSAGICAAQVSRSCVAIQGMKNKVASVDLGTQHITSIAVNSELLVVSSTQGVHVYRMSDDGAYIMNSSIPLRASSLAIHQDTLVVATDNRVMFTTLDGVAKLSIFFGEHEGFPIALDLSGSVFAVATNLGVIKVMRIVGKEFKYVGRPVRLWEKIKCGGNIRSLKCNADGSRISIIVKKLEDGIGDMKGSRSCLFVYDIDHDLIDSFQFDNYFPVSHFWDPDEPTLISCEAKHFANGFEDVLTETNDSSTVVYTFFVTKEFRICEQDMRPIPNDCDNLIGLDAPFHYFKCADVNGSGKNLPICTRELLKDFVTFEKDDSETRSALMKFSRFKAMGDMEEALQAIVSIRNPGVWENLAQSCVQARSTEVAEICLANMGYARGSSSVRLAKLEPEPEVAVAAVATQLGVLDEAATLYKSCKRYDLLNKLYLSQGKWEDALEVARNHDRIHLKTTQYQYAKHCADVGDIDRAIVYFEKAGVAASAVPKLLFEANQMERLEEYVDQSGNAALFKWLAAYYESIGYFDQAADYYGRAEDKLSLVRVACHMDNIEHAAELVSTSGCAASAHFLARQLEGMGVIREAIEYYRQSGTFGHAIRLSKAYGLDAELMSFALRSRASLMRDCARYFEEKKEYEKAATLYKKCGCFRKSIDVSLCISREENGANAAQIFDLVDSALDTLKKDSDYEECIQNYVDFLIDMDQINKAVQVLCIRSKQIERAIDLCAKHKITISEAMVEDMSPDYGDVSKHIVVKLAKILRKQGQYQLACKKFTQAGDRLSALKCLVKGGLTSNIIKYATVSRNREIYILSANYLQHLDWRGDESIRKTIIRFYKKANSADQLAAFMEACNEESSASEDDYIADESVSASIFDSGEVDEDIVYDDSISS